ncbi:putative Calcium-transporting ATPase 1 [Blattamonas nauphoetae]|uniref:Calcium-transporting ATPase 1 n=1 Tax=Blattamonas nauphoetae TaxID=2049346 RepID=A0ABQ9YBP0_9EUKA|nr:putative Calcium-transporting ATPase 1 [Blattamonas nauphoetae]
MQQWTEGIVIFIVVIINAITGFVQEYKADKASEALDKLLSLESEVIRRSVRTKIGTKELVHGDIVIIQSGDKVPADCRVFDVNQLHTEEAALTGETTANPKFVCIHDVDTVLGDRSNMLFSSTYVAKGTGTAICVETGVRTEIGKISSMVANVKQEKTPLTPQMTQFGHILVIITLVLIVVAFLCVKFVHYQEISWG